MPNKYNQEYDFWDTMNMIGMLSDSWILAISSSAPTPLPSSAPAPTPTPTTVRAELVIISA